MNLAFRYFNLQNLNLFNLKLNVGQRHLQKNLII